MVRVIDSAEKLQNILSLDIDESKADEMVFSLNMKDYSEPVIRALIGCVKKYSEHGYKTKIEVKVNELDFEVSDFEGLITLEDYIKKVGSELKFVDNLEEYTLDESLSAYLKCKDYGEYIKNIDASPLEKYLMIYRYLTSYVYQENLNEPLKARQMISVLNSNDIVCVGYSKLMKYLCTAAGIPCEIQNLYIHKKNTSRVGVHQNNVVYIKDDKYGIDGYYYSDSCWDSIKKNKEPFLKYNYALLPLQDVHHVKDKKFEFFKNTAILYSDDSLEDMLVNKSLCSSLGEKFGFKYNKMKLPEFFRDMNNQGSKISKATAKLKEIFKQAGVPADYLSKKNHSVFPTCFYPEFFIAMLVVDPPQYEIINSMIERIKLFAAGEESLSKPAYLKNTQSYGYDDIYQEMDNFAAGDFNFNIWDIEEYYENVYFASEFGEYILGVRASSVPVKKETIKEAIKNSMIAEGCDEKYATSQTERSFEYCMRRAEKIFDRMASNCFSVAAANRRATQQAVQK